MRDEAAMRRINVDGSRRVLGAAGAAGVETFLFASSSGAYAEAAKSRAVDESWPLGPPGGSPYARQNVEVEGLIDTFGAAHPGTRVIRFRIAVAWKREAATQSRRIFAGPFFPRRLARPGLIPVIPDIPKLRFQCVHTDDVAEAIRLAIFSDAKGAFNVAADPPLDARELARILGARVVPAPPGSARIVRAWLDGLWRLRLQPLSPSWFDMVIGLPILDCTRARTELGWKAAHTPEDVVRELLDGIRHGADAPTPPLARGTSGPGRTHEVSTGVGGDEP
jgi:UDP-glucose 4-epimerase